MKFESYRNDERRHTNVSERSTYRDGREKIMKGNAKTSNKAGTCGTSAKKDNLSESGN
jgi:hypothetical protein